MIYEMKYLSSKTFFQCFMMGCAPAREFPARLGNCINTKKVHINNKLHLKENADISTTLWIYEC